MFIRGTGKTKFGFLSDSIPQLLHKSMDLALQDADMKASELDAIYVANFNAGPLQNSLHLNSLVSSLLPNLNIPTIRIESACASGGAAFYEATLTLPKYENIMIVGVEKMTNVPIEKCTDGIAAAGDYFLDQAYGVIFPAGYAMIASAYMEKYGIEHNVLEEISFKNHQNSLLNPTAHFNYKKVNRDMIRNSPIVSSPLHLFDCSPISDGSAAVILSRQSKSNRDIKVLASSLSNANIAIVQSKDLTTFPAAKKSAALAFAQAKIKPENVNFAEVHDCFTIAEVLAMEDLGLSQIGKSGDLILNGDTGIKGRIPINPSGGLKAAGHPIGATGVSQICEAVKQLRNQAGEYQVKNPEIGITHNVGGFGGSAVVSVFGK